MYCTSETGTEAKGWMTTPIGILHWLTRSLLQGTEYKVDRMKRGLQLPGKRDT